MPSDPSAKEIPSGRSIAADLGQQYEDLYSTEKLEITAANGVAVAVVPRGRQVVSLKKYLDEFATKPDRREGTVVAYDEASFAAFTNRFKGPDTVLFADPSPTAPSLTAVLDYHPEGPTQTDAAFGRFRVQYAFPLSEEWQRWTAVHGKYLSQVEFAQFVEDRIADFAVVEEAESPVVALAAQIGGRLGSPSNALALSKGLQLNVDVRVKQAVQLESGIVSLVYDEQHKDGAGSPITTPNLFAIDIPVFRFGQRYRIPVRLRYRMTDGRMSWAFVLYRHDKAFETAFTQAVKAAQAATGVATFQGKA